ncbi:hypothetical protein CAter282_4323 [Collimonas arenae]|uniref:Uncharacterized protein n=1 Tax=Collimonas arenae TaxID=279058 RepID=A0A127QPJ0_9BURK|nr:hypothetical protein CAter282_4323 [Collimonas arenae]
MAASISVLLLLALGLMRAKLPLVRMRRPALSYAYTLVREYVIEHLTLEQYVHSLEGSQTPPGR